MPITVTDEMNDTERSFNYIINYNFDFIDIELESNLQRTGCNCTDNCRDKTKCSCWQLTIKRLLGKTDINQADINGNQHEGYSNMRLEEIVSTGIVECGGNCKCCVDRCQNRVVQHGLQHMLELFKTTGKHSTLSHPT